MPKYKYDTGVDYQSMIDKAVKAGDLQSAAIYEAQRNAKIAGEGLGYETTNLYSQYLPKVEQNTDYMTGAYGAEIGGLAKDIAGSIGQGFTYDYENDPVYQAMYAQYEKDAGKGMEDTLAKVSARTGGLASSYAGQAAQQTYDDTMQQVYSTLIPQLREQRYQEWQAKMGNQMDLMQMLMGMDDVAYQRGVAADNEEYDRAVQRAETLAQFGDFSGYEALGYSPEEIARMQQIYQQSLYSGSGSGGGDTGEGPTQAKIMEAVSKYNAYLNGDYKYVDADVYETLLSAGYKIGDDGSLIAPGSKPGSEEGTDIPEWAMVDGLGQVKKADLARMLAAGEIVIVNNSGTPQYRYVGKGRAGMTV